MHFIDVLKLLATGYSVLVFDSGVLQLSDLVVLFERNQLFFKVVSIELIKIRVGEYFIMF